MDFKATLHELEESRGRRYSKHAEDFADWLRESEHYSVDVLEAQSGHIKAYLRHLKNEGAYLTEGEAGYASTTLHLALVALSQFYQTADDFGEEVENPADDVSVTDLDGIRKIQSLKSEKIRGKHVVLSDEEIKSLINHAPAPALRNELIIKLMLQTACRRGEMTHIRLQDVNRESRKIKIFGEKTDDYRIVKYQNALKPLMRQWIDVDRRAYSSAETSDYLFCSRQSGQLSSYQMGETVKKAADNAEIQEVLGYNSAGQPVHRITSHALRSTALTRLLNEGMSTLHLREYAGHAQVSQVEEYLSPTDDEVLEAVDSAGEAFDY
jgi:integrase/recombinase XerD